MLLVCNLWTPSIRTLSLSPSTASTIPVCRAYVPDNCTTRLPMNDADASGAVGWGTIEGVEGAVIAFAVSSVMGTLAGHALTHSFWPPFNGWEGPMAHIHTYTHMVMHRHAPFLVAVHQDLTGSQGVRPGPSSFLPPAFFPSPSPSLPLPTVSNLAGGRGGESPQSW